MLLLRQEHCPEKKLNGEGGMAVLALEGWLLLNWEEETTGWHWRLQRTLQHLKSLFLVSAPQGCYGQSEQSLAG